MECPAAWWRSSRQHGQGEIWFYEQSTPDQGRAAAGRAASALDASTAYTNPAGMSRLDSTQFLMGAGALVIQSSFDTAAGTTQTGAHPPNANLKAGLLGGACS